MFTDKASSSHKSDRVQKYDTSPPANTTATTMVVVAGRPRNDRAGDVGSRAGASESRVTGRDGNTGRPAHRDAGTRSRSAPNARNDVARERLQAVGRGSVTEPQHELAAAGVDEFLHLLPHLLGGTHEVVA